MEAIIKRQLENYIITSNPGINTSFYKGATALKAGPAFILS
jgi:hypothetical protein